MYRNGDNGIVLVGDAHLMDGSGGNQPRGVQVLRNVIFDNGVWGKQVMIIFIPMKRVYVMLCPIWYHLYNFKKMNTTHGGIKV